MSLHTVHIPTADEEAATILEGVVEHLNSAQAKLCLLGDAHVRERVMITNLREYLVVRARVLRAGSNKEGTCRKC